MEELYRYIVLLICASDLDHHVIVPPSCSIKYGRLKLQERSFRSIDAFNSTVKTPFAGLSPSTNATASPKRIDDAIWFYYGACDIHNQSNPSIKSFTLFELSYHNFYLLSLGVLMISIGSPLHNVLGFNAQSEEYFRFFQTLPYSTIYS